MWQTEGQTDGQNLLRIYYAVRSAVHRKQLLVNFVIVFFLPEKLTWAFFCSQKTRASLLINYTLSYQHGLWRENSVDENNISRSVLRRPALWIINPLKARFFSNIFQIYFLPFYYDIKASNTVWFLPRKSRAGLTIRHAVRPSVRL